MHSQFIQFLKEEDASLEAIHHLPHVGELLYTANTDHVIKHLEATHDMLTGKKQSNHNLSYKADGKVSIVFGKRNNVPFVKYKGSGSPALQSEQEIHNHIEETGKTHLLQPFLYGFQAASHPKVGKHSSYQGDVMIPSEDNSTVDGNIVKYKKPRDSVTHAIAVHTHIDTQTGKKIAANPDVSFLETTGSHFPNLNLSNRKFDISKDESAEIAGHIGSAKKILADSAVSDISNEIAKHRDPTNKMGHRHLHFIKFSNAVQRGSSARSVESMKEWTQEKITVTKGKEQERLKGHLDFIHHNGNNISKLFAAHNHVDAARSSIVDIIHKLPDLPMTPQGGHSEGEGFVSEIPDAGQVKFVPTSFTIRNNQNKERFQRNG